MARTVSASTFADALWPAQGANRALRVVILVLLGTGLLTLSAKIQVPFFPVPMTLQTLVVLLLGLAYGSVLGAATVLAYLAEGALGLPVFAGTPGKGLGLAYMLGPTGGYLLGFALAAGVAGWIAEYRPGLPGLVSAVAAGTLAIYVPGLLWLATFVGIEQAIAVGLVPFVWADLAKGALAIALGTAGWALLRKRVAP